MQEYQRRQMLRQLQFENEVRRWNQSPDVQDIIRNRSRLINNTNGYFTGNDRHQLRQIQLMDQEMWDLLFGGQYGEYLHADASVYGTRIIQDMQMNDGFEVLDISLLVNENVEHGGIHQMIFFISVYPHQSMRYGHMVRYDVVEGSEQYEIIEDLFRATGDNPNAVVGECSEYEMLEVLADEYEMLDLLHYVFLRGIHSRQFQLDGGHLIHEHAFVGLNRRLREQPQHNYNDYYDDEDNEDNDDDNDDEPIYAAAIPPPPPPPQNDYNLAEIYHRIVNNENNQMNHIDYQEQVAARRNENNQMWYNLVDNFQQDQQAQAAQHAIFEDQNNIIGYWMENDARVNEYLDIMNERAQINNVARIQG